MCLTGVKYSRTTPNHSCPPTVGGVLLAPLRDVSAATKDVMPPSQQPTDDDGSAEKHVVLILSSDVVAAALLGALVETLGYLVQFHQPPGDADDAFRRSKPSVAMVDCGDPSLLSAELLGRARMRGVSVVIFGTRSAMTRVRDLAKQFELQELIMPVSLDALDETLQQAISEVC